MEHTFEQKKNDMAIKNDIISLKDEMMAFRSEIKDEMIAFRFEIKAEMAALRSDLIRTIYLTSLIRLVAIIASVVTVAMILKK